MSSQFGIVIEMISEYREVVDASDEGMIVGGEYKPL